MARQKQAQKWTVAKGQETDYPRILDAAGHVLAVVTSNDESDAHLMAAAPQMFERLTDVRNLKKLADGKGQQPLLPAESLAAIDAALKSARP